MYRLLYRDHRRDHAGEVRVRKKTNGRRQREVRLRASQFGQPRTHHRFLGGVLPQVRSMESSDMASSSIIPMTKDFRCRFVDLPAMQESGVVDLADIFISFSNNATLFGDLIAAISDGVDYRRRVWTDRHIRCHAVALCKERPALLR